MGVLTNVRFERFAQEIARGSPVRKAYTIAGYRANRGNASRLRLHQGIKARIAELQSQKSAAVELAQLTAAERAGVDQFWVLRNLRRNAIQAMRHGDRAAAARSLELIGKHIGMFVDRKEIQISHIDDSDQYLASLMELIQGKTIEHEPGLQQLENDGLNDGSDSKTEDDTIDIIEERA